MNSFVGSVFPGAVWAVFNEHESVVRCYGAMSYEHDSPRMNVDCIFDLASLTKVMATTMVLLSLAEDGYFDLDANVSSFFPGVSVIDKTIRDLLQHRSGLPDYFPMAQIPVGQQAQDEWIFTSLQKPRVPVKTQYSCLNFLLLQTIAEQLGGSTFHSLFQSRVAEPLGLTSACFTPPVSLRDRIPPTERRSKNRREWESLVSDQDESGEYVHGVVHDPAALLRGGVSGNAGLFSKVSDVIRVGQCWLQEGQGVCSRERFRTWTSPEHAGLRGLGFDIAQPNGPVVKGGFTVGRAFGHNGFSGTSIWVDPVLRTGCALLSNRIHPTSEGPSMDAARAHAIRLALTTMIPK